jgi:hypothetical protein
LVKEVSGCQPSLDKLPGQLLAAHDIDASIFLLSVPALLHPQRHNTSLTIINT